MEGEETIGACSVIFTCFQKDLNVKANDILTNTHVFPYSM
jgi:hypothetical protein